MDFTKTFATDKTLENEGVDVAIGDGAVVKICRMGNPAWKKVFGEKVTPYRAQIRMGKMDEDLAERLHTEAVAETILVGWSGFTDNGEAVGYSVANAVAMMTKFPEFKAMVLELAGERATFQQIGSEVAEGN
jgi:hypothetical protein